MTHIKAMTLALEALEASARNWPSDSIIEAITAIKEALSTKCVAQPEKTVCPFCSSEWVTAEQHDRKMDRMEQERCVGCEACIDTACGRDECPKGWPKAAQPEQKPFAWYAIEHGEADIEWNSQRPIYEGNWKPLYRTPPQRTEQEQQIETLKRCLFQMQEAAKDLVKQAKSLPSTQRKPLTDEEIGAILEGVNAYGTRLYTFARAIEAKLKEKNT